MCHAISVAGAWHDERLGRCRSLAAQLERTGATLERAGRYGDAEELYLQVASAQNTITGTCKSPLHTGTCRLPLHNTDTGTCR